MPRSFLFRSSLIAVCGALCFSVAAIGQVSYTSMPLDSGFGPLDNSAPPVPAQQIIDQFAAKESIFRKALDNYTYQRSVRVQTLDDDSKPDGEYYEVTDIVFDPGGHRTEHVVDAPESTLQRVMMSPADFQDIEERLPFVLTTEDIAQYNVTYVGKEKVDEVECYVFDVAPKVIEKKKRYFQGRIWVDEKDLQIVVTNGKNVPDDLRKGHEDLSIPFVTFRQQIDGKYWFPVYTHGDGILHFSGGNGYMSQSVHLRETLKYTNYQQFGASIRILMGGQDIGGDQKGRQNGQQPSSSPQPSSQPQH
ncbi:hypothetical protein [Paracidobacterium acidisoli]|uniref:Outer membrane lipoprotein-sorting protein n=1 Tax=Paracidobacterium acidisoli TaxID=2303751 RepID=A0A372IP38_9BACT|nr:hypothetical protein [Paracidobacterium acidisoli]MBT9332193.1 hypothetical protein [Paracidobacterium acidisoli]